MRLVRSPTRTLCGWLLLFSLPVLARDYRFDGSMSEEVLRSYLSRSMTTMYLLTGHGDFDDNLRMLTNCGVKFAGRAVYQWGREESGAPAIPRKLEGAKERAAKIHRADPELILQACIFEIISRDVNDLPVPAWTFEELGQPVEARNFRYEEMIYPSGRGSNQWGQGSSVPDVSRSETKLWFYFLARSYIDIGCEAIHYGQAELMNGNDPKLDHWAEVLAQARRYAAKHARRHFIVCDAHVPHGGLLRDATLLFDFHSFPLRIEEIPANRNKRSCESATPTPFMGAAAEASRRAAGVASTCRISSSSTTTAAAAIPAKPARAVSGSGAGMKSRGFRDSQKTCATTGCATRGTGYASTTRTATWKCPACASSPALPMANAGTR